MAKPKTVAKATLVSTDSNGNAVITTEGTKSAPGTRISNWWAFWGDGASYNGVNAPPTNLNYKYNKTGDFPFSLYVVDNKGYKAESPMIIVRISPPPPPTTPPSILGISPGSGNIGAAVVITGTNFGSTQGTSKVYFNGVQAIPNSWGATSITCNVPNGATTGQVIVVVNNQSSNGFPFTVTGAATYNYYVSTTGNNAWDGTSPTFVSGNIGPFATVQHAMEVVGHTTSLKRIGVRGGNYQQTVIDPVCSGIDFNNRVVVQNYNGEIVWLIPTSTTKDGGIDLNSSCSYVEFSGINLDTSALNVGGLKLSTSHHIRYSNAEIIGSKANNDYGWIVGMAWGSGGGHQLISLVIHNGASYAIYAAEVDVLIDGCLMYDVGTAGVHSYASSGDPSGLIMRNCEVRDLFQGYFFQGGINPDLWGVLLEGSNAEVYNNVFHHMNIRGASPGAQSAGVHVYTGTDGSKIRFNTCADNTGCRGIQMASWGAVQTNIEITNNIAFNNSAGDFSPFGVSGINYVASHNSWQAPVNGADPSFVNAAAYNYQLNPGSPCKGVGVAILGITTDKNGTLRSDPPSEGAYE